MPLMQGGLHTSNQAPMAHHKPRGMARCRHSSSSRHTLARRTCTGRRLLIRVRCRCKGHWTVFLQCTSGCAFSSAGSFQVLLCQPVYPPHLLLASVQAPNPPATATHHLVVARPAATERPQQPAERHPLGSSRLRSIHSSRGSHQATRRSHIRSPATASPRRARTATRQRPMGGPLHLLATTRRPEVAARHTTRPQATSPRRVLTASRLLMVSSRDSRGIHSHTAGTAALRRVGTAASSLAAVGSSSSSSSSSHRQSAGSGSSRRARPARQGRRYPGTAPSSQVRGQQSLKAALAAGHGSNSGASGRGPAQLAHSTW